MKNIVAIHAGPRNGWNTDSLIRSAAEGAEEAGAAVEFVDLFRLEKYTGCVSCFGCKSAEGYGKCVCRDGLYGVLEKIRQADGMIIGSPVYFGNLTASFHALYERLLFQYLTYNKDAPYCNPRRIPVLLIVTSNCAEEDYDELGYAGMLERYRSALSRFIGPTELFCCGNTLQISDYSKYDWTMFDAEEKKKHHNDTFGEYLLKARDLGRRL